MAPSLSQRIACIASAMLVFHARNGRAESGDTAPSAVESSDVVQVEAIEAMLAPYLMPKGANDSYGSILLK